MLIRARTGMDPMKMTYIRFNGILSRIQKINRTMPGGGVTEQQLIAERVAEGLAASAEES